MKKILSFIMVLISLVACTDQGRYEATISRADSLIENHQDSVRFALEMLDSLKPEYPDFSKRLQMRYLLIYAKGMNKGFINFTTDSVMKLVADYYDDHGTSNEQMLAHYLLGCTYRDMCEYPAALSCYQDAVEKADTMDVACDYSLLTRIYQQEGGLFLHQNMPQNAEEVLKKAEKAAWMAKDTLAALLSREHLVRVCNGLGEFRKALSIGFSLQKAYRKYGYIKESIRVYGQFFKPLLRLKRYSELKKYMEIYERESGYFNGEESHAICYAHYYYIKGMLNLALKSHTSSEYIDISLKKSTNFHDKVNAYYGLYCYSKSIDNLDSIKKYVDLFVINNDSARFENEVGRMQNIASSYRYNTLQKTILSKEMESKKMQLFMFVFLLCFAMILFASIVYVMNLRKKQQLNYLKLCTYKQQIQMVDNELKDKRELLNQLSSNFNDVSNIVKKKNEQIEKMQQELQVLEEGVCCQEPFDDGKGEIMNKAIVLVFKKNVVQGNMATEKQWAILENVFKTLLPQFKKTLEKNEALKENEYRICMLVWLEFKPKDIQILMGMSASNVSNRKRMAVKVFGNDMTASKFDMKIRNILNS